MVRVRAHVRRSKRGRVGPVVRHARGKPIAIVGRIDPDAEHELFARVVKPSNVVYRFHPTASDPMGFIQPGENDPRKVTMTNPHVMLYWTPPRGGDEGQIRLEWYYEGLKGPAMDYEIAAAARSSGLRVNAPEVPEEFEPNIHEDVYSNDERGAEEASRRLSFLLGRQVTVRPTTG